MRLIWIVMMTVALSGCATTKPTIQINVNGDFESHPNYNVTLRFD